MLHECKDDLTSENPPSINQYIDGLMERNNTGTSIDTEKILDTIQQFLL